MPYHRDHLGHRQPWNAVFLPQAFWKSVHHTIDKTNPSITFAKLYYIGESNFESTHIIIGQWLEAF
jgi:hypothetical protein